MGEKEVGWYETAIFIRRCIPSTWYVSHLKFQDSHVSTAASESLCAAIPPYSFAWNIPTELLSNRVFRKPMLVTRGKIFMTIFRRVVSTHMYSSVSVSRFYVYLIGSSWGSTRRGERGKRYGGDQLGPSMRWAGTWMKRVRGWLITCLVMSGPHHRSLLNESGQRFPPMFSSAHAVPFNVSVGFTGFWSVRLGMWH